MPTLDELEKELSKSSNSEIDSYVDELFNEPEKTNPKFTGTPSPLKTNPLDVNVPGLNEVPVNSDPLSKNINSYHQSEKASKDQIRNQQLKDVQQKKKEIEDEYQAGRKENDISPVITPEDYVGPALDIQNPDNFDAINQGQTGKEILDKAQNFKENTAPYLKLAKRNYEQAERTLSAPQSDDVNSFKERISATWDGLTDIDKEYLMSAGWNEVANSKLYYDIKRKLDKGEEPTDAEIKSLESLMTANASKQISDPSLLYSASKSISENVPFILQILYTGGLSGAIQKSSMKVLDKLGQKWGLKMAEKGFAKTAQTIGKKALVNIPATVAAEPLTSMFYQGIFDNMAGNATQDENGNFQFQDAKSFLPAVGKSLNDTFAEYYFESSGDWAKQAMESLPIRRLFGKLPVGQISDAYTKFAKATKYNGPIYEYLEEELNGLYSGLTTGDQSVKDYFSLENQKQVAASVLAMSFGFGMLQAPGKVMDWNDYRNKISAFNSISDKGVKTQVESALSKPSYSEQVDGLSNIDYSKLNDNDRKAVVDFVIAKQKSDLYTGWKEDEADEASSPLRNAVTGDIHPATVRNEVNEDGSPKSVFIIQDTGANGVIVFDPSQGKPIMINSKSIIRDNVVPYQNWIRDNAQGQIENEIINNEAEEVVSQVPGEQNQEMPVDTPQVDYKPSQNITYVDPETGNTQDYVISQIQPDGTIFADNENGSIEITPDQYSNIQSAVQEQAPVQNQEQVQGQTPEEKKVTSWTTDKQDEEYLSVENPDGTHTFDFASPNKTKAEKTAQKIQENSNGMDISVVEIPNPKNSNQPFWGIMGKPVNGKEVKTEGSSAPITNEVTKPEQTENKEVKPSENKVQFKYYDGVVRPGTVVGEENGKIKVKGDDGLNYKISPEMISGNNETKPASKNTLVSDERYQQLKSRLKEKLGNLNSGFDPELLAIGSEMAAYHIEKGARKFVDFSKSMIQDLGENIKPYLKSFYLAAKNLPGLSTEDMDKASFVEDFDLNTLNGKEQKSAEKIQQSINRKQAAKNRQFAPGFPKALSYVLSFDPQSPEQTVLQFIARGGKFKIDDIKHELGQNAIKEYKLNFIVSKNGVKLDTFFEDTPWSEWGNGNSGVDFIIEIIQDPSRNSVKGSAERLKDLMSVPEEIPDAELSDYESGLMDEALSEETESLTSPEDDEFWNDAVENPVSEDEFLKQLDENNVSLQNNTQHGPENQTETSETVQADSNKNIDGEGNSDRGSLEGSSSDNSRSEEKDLTQLQQAELDKKLSEIDNDITTKEQTLSKLKQERSNKLDELQSRNGLFGDTKASDNDLFAGQFVFNKETVNKGLSGIDSQISQAEKEIERLKKLRQGTIDNAGKQQELIHTPETNAVLYLENKKKSKEVTSEESKVNTEPTEAQKEAGNYKMGHVNVQGLDISIENPKGSIRRGTDKDGKPWEIEINNTYGYIRGTKGKDKDHVDVFLGDNLTSEKVFVIDQVNSDGSFDEHKVMIGFSSEQEAKNAYLSNYQKGWTGLGAITEMPMDEFKKWVYSEETKKPLALNEESEFEQWFKGSKVVDENGNPLIVHHGTKGDFENFVINLNKRDYGALGYGIYFTDNLENATNYANNAEGEGTPKIKHVYLNIKNPYNWLSPIKSTRLPDEKQAKKITERLQQKGYDGIKYDNGFGATWYVVFDSNQIKTVKDEIVSENNPSNEQKTEENTQPKQENSPKQDVFDKMGSMLAGNEYSIPEKYDLKSFSQFESDLADGKIKINDFKRAFKVFQASKEDLLNELKTKTKSQLLDNFNSFGKARYKNENKDSIIKALHSDNLMTFAFGTISYGMGERMEDIVAKKVEGTTQEDIDNYVADIAKRREERAKMVAEYKKSLSDPETLEQFKTFIRVKGLKELTPEQRAKYDDLVSDKVRDERKTDLEKKAEVSKVELGDTSMKVIETKHTKTGEPLFVVQLSDRVEREVYNDLNNKAKKLGGYYSSFRGNGAVPGFTFKDKGQAEKFVALKEGDVSNVDVLEQRQEDKKASVAERLKETANGIIEAADEELNKDRLTNTYRRANMANVAEARANKSKRIGQTMLNIADAIESGKAKLLDGIKAKTHILLLDKLIKSARYHEISSKFSNASYNDRLAQESEPATVETVEYLKNGYLPSIYSRNLLDLINKVEDKKGVKLIAARWKKKIAHLGEYDNYQLRHEDEAQELEDMFNSMSESDRKYNRIGDEIADYKRLKSMGIENDSMLRAALREYVQYRGGEIEQDKVKKLERALAGKKNVGIDFFPTPHEVAEMMVNEADIAEGMAVLEPSAGNGNIADAIKDAGVMPDVVELSSSLREILEAKGYNVVENDFMNLNDKKYDRIIMNPPFSNGMDGEHVQHAYEILKPGGRIIAIVGEGTFIRSDKKAQAFREWLESVNGSEERLPENTFTDKKLLNTTQANARLVIIDKPEGDLKLRHNSPFYSNTEHALNSITQEKATPEQWKAMLLKNGAKQAEMDWMGLDEYLAGKKSVTKQELADFIEENKVKLEEVVKQEINNFTKDDIVSIKVNYDGSGNWLVKFKDEDLGTIQFPLDKADDEQEATDHALELVNYDNAERRGQKPKYASYTIPGGKNYKEWLLTMPSRNDNLSDDEMWEFRKIDEKPYYERTPEEQSKLVQYQNRFTKSREKDNDFKSSHWNEPNIVAHIRSQEFTDKDGNKVLLVEEVQSDWQQKGRKDGFKMPESKKKRVDEIIKRLREIAEENKIDPTNIDEIFKLRDSNEEYRKLADEGLAINTEFVSKEAAPDMPFKNTDQIIGLGMKRMLRYAAENGFDKVAWTTGEQQAERYDLSKQIDNIKVEKSSGKKSWNYKLFITDKKGATFTEYAQDGNELEGIVGKDLATKIVNDVTEPYKETEYSGLDLKVGGEGMKGFYDQILPTWVNKYVKKWGAKVGETEIDTTPSIDGNINMETGELANPTSKKYLQVHSVDITPEMRESVLSGQPMFREGDGIGQSNTPEDRKRDLQDYYDKAKSPSKVVVVNNAKEAVEAYSQHGGESESIAEEIRDYGQFDGMYLNDVNLILTMPHNIHSKEQADVVLIHENLHSGITKVIPDKAKRTQLNYNVYKSVIGDLNNVVPKKYYGLRLSSQGEEYLAFKAEQLLLNGEINPENSFSPEELEKIITKEILTGDEVIKLINTFVSKYSDYGNETDQHSISERNISSGNSDNRGTELHGRDGAQRDDYLGGIQSDAEEVSQGLNSNGKPISPTPQGIENFWKWFGNSEIVDEQGRPMVMYHGTAGNFNSFQPNKIGAIFASPSESFAEKGFMPFDLDLGTSGSIMPVYVKAENPFDYRNPKHIEKLFDRLGDNLRDKVKENVKRGDPWGIEKPVVVSAIKDMGHDGFYVTENDVVNIAVFDPTQLKSATGNFGGFDPNDSDVRRRDKKPPEPPSQDVFDRLNDFLSPKKVLNKFDLFREGIQDNMTGWRKVQEGEGLKVKDSSNVYLADNQKNSKAQAKWENYHDKLFKPALKIIASLESFGKSMDIKPYVDLEERFKKGEISKEIFDQEVERLDIFNISRYMIAKHAPERNATMREQEVSKYEQDLMYNLEIDKQEGKLTPEDYVNKVKEIQKKVEKKREDVSEKVFSGMTDKQAERIVNSFEAGIPNETIDNLWESWNKATDEVQKMWVEYGKFNQETYEANKARGWKYYVPLRGWEPTSEDIDWDYNKESGKGEFNGVAKMEGRRSVADDPIANMYQIAQSAIKWGEKNRVKQAALRLVRDNSGRTDLFYQKKAWYLSNDDGTWTEVIKDGGNVYQIKGYDQDGNMDLELLGSASELVGQGHELKASVHYEHELRNPKNKIDQHEIEVMMNGEKFFVVTRDPKLANEVKKAELLQMGGFLQTLGKVTRTVSALRTAKNPAWVLKNVTRDFLGAVQNTWIENDTKAAGLFVKNFGNAMAFLARGKEGQEKSRYMDLWKEFVDGGGRTGTTNLQDLDTIKSDLRKEIIRMNRSTMAKVRPDRSLGVLLNYVDRLAQSTENLTRFAAYVTARDQGKSVIQAVNAAKEISVNFDRKGNWSTSIGALIGFFNASMQGAVKQLHLAKNHPLRYGLSAGVGLASMGYIMSAIYSYFWDPEDEKEDYRVQNKYNRFNNMIIAPGKGSWMIPYAQGYRFWNSVGCIVYDLAHGKTDAETASYDLVDQISAALSPVDIPSIYDKDTKDVNLYSSAKFISILEPIISINENKDYKGSPIHREAFTKEDENYTPKSQLYLRNVNPVIKALTDNLFRLGGGDPKVKSVYKLNGSRVPGLMDWNPSNIEYTIKTLGAGPGTFILDAITFGSKIGEKSAEKELKDRLLGDATNGFDFTTVPILNSFYRSKYKGRVDDEYKKLSDWYKKHENTYREHMKDERYDQVMDAILSNQEYEKFLDIKDTEEYLTKLYKEKKKLPDNDPIQEDIDLDINHEKLNLVSKYMKP